MKFYFQDLNPTLASYTKIYIYGITISSKVRFICNNYSYFYINIPINF